ncbi:hypothetical protein LY90DRAFT_503935 [Neocallimastix californiae]|uniref:MULE transposase domain-containing protein n=1 Tax=Neocallimastix californiae TaxID=1754190 RepID=A0A1Y2EGY1_9FUNG|nr:hypothetical protein LY90DRAFT_503935 [Neocallimastix californiae]|eukprot:ORY70832.1 hypothetical protein LY90DRAFT_503935 [Neocallimastix californiae]
MELKKSSIPYGIKIKPLYNKISKEMRFICLEYNSIKSQISRNLNKNYHPMEYNDDIFVDGTFFIAPKFSYQIFITRIYTKELDSFYTTSFAILQNKEQEIYKILKKLKKKKNANTCNNNNIIAESIVNLFLTIPSYYKLIDKLNELEHLPYYDYQRKIRGI